MIERKRIAIAVLAALLIGVSIFVFISNRHDQQEKSALLKKNLELLENSPVVKRIEEKLMPYDSLPHNVVKEIICEMLNLKEETQEIYYLNPWLVVAQGEKYLSISSQSHNYRSKEFSPIRGDVKAVLKELKKKDADIFSVLDGNNRDAFRKKIIFLIATNKNNLAYLFIEYYITEDLKKLINSI